MLTTTQKTLVQDTFATIVPIADDAAALFYRRLFEIDPSLRGMFPEDIAPQRKKLVQTLAMPPDPIARRVRWRSRARRARASLRSSS
jgi:hemoglobin-like flavoprotein